MSLKYFFIIGTISLIIIQYSNCQSNNTKRRGKKQKQQVNETDGEQVKIQKYNSLNSTWMEEWEKKMQDFQADNILTFELQGKQQEILLEEIVKPCTIRGAYFIGYDSKDPISFKIINPLNKTIYKKIDKRESIFSINLKLTGEFQFVFSNLKYNSKKTIYMAIDVSDNEEHLQIKDLDPLQQQLYDVQITINDYYQQTKFASKKRDSHASALKQTHDYLLLFSLFETIAILACTGWQIYYIKKILDNRSIV